MENPTTGERPNDTAAVKIRCCKRVYRSGGSFRGHSCSKKATVSFEGSWYCTVHNPVRVAQKRTEQEAKWDAESAANTKRWRLEKAAPEMLDALIELLPESNDDPINLGRPTFEACERARAAITKATGA